MTANQLQYAANKIEQEKADELARHNDSVEQETERHNVSLEDLQKESNDIADAQEKENERHNAAMEEIQRQYNDTYLRLQETQGNAKIAIEEQLAYIKELEAAENARHNEANEALQSRVNDISQQHEDEVNRHNTELEKLQAEMNKVNQYEADIKAKQQLAQSLYWSQSITQQEVDSLRKHTISLKQVENANYANMLGIYELQQRQKEWQDTEAQRDVNVFKTLASGIGDIIGGAARGIGGLIAPGINLGKITSTLGY